LFNSLIQPITPKASRRRHGDSDTQWHGENCWRYTKGLFVFKLDKTIDLVNTPGQKGRVFIQRFYKH